MTDKRRERDYVERARHLNTSLPPGELEDSEAPDFLLASSGCRLGIEVTAFHRPLTRSQLVQQEQTRHRASLLRGCRREMGRLRRHDRLHVTVYFDERVDLRVMAVCDAINELPRLLQSLQLPQETVTRVDRSTLLLPEAIEGLDVARYPWLPNHSWVTPELGHLPVVQPHEVEAVVGKKEERLAAYRRRAEAVWLLIVLEGLRANGAGKVTDSVVRHNYVSAFNGIVLYDVVTEAAWQLRTIS